MDKKLFKGFKQVSSTQFNAAKEAGTLDGYLWFVRTTVTVEGEDTNDVANDEFDIYFGKKQYGHFCNGEIPALKGALDVIREDLGFAPGAFTFGDDVTTIQGAFDSITEMFATLTTATETNKAAHEANAASITAIETTLATHLVKNVDTNDKVLSVADGILSSAISLTYENNRISLVGKNNEEIAGFDASEFIKDSVLDDVKIETREDGEKYIVFTWKTEGDNTKTDELKVSDFAKLYTAGTALELAEDGVTFNVKVAANDNFLSVNDNNELIVDDMTVDKTKLKEAITIEGGPLASDSVKAAFTGGVIPAGTDIQSVLKALLCVEIYPTTSNSTPDYAISISAPTISATGGTNNGLVEIGKVINFGIVTAKAVSVSSKTEPVVSGFDNGYSATIDGEINENTSVSGAWTIGQKSETVYTLTAEKTNFTGDIPASGSNATNTSCTLAACSLTAVAGDNTYKVIETAPVYVGTYTGVAEQYIVSNLGGRSEEKKSTAIAAQTTNVERSATSQSATFKVTGVYPVYTNGVSASTTDATAAAMADLASPVTGDGTKLALMKSGTSFAVSFAAQGAEPYRLFLPGTWKVTSASAIDGFTSKYAIDCKADFKTNGTTTRTVQGNEVTYTVYEWAGKEGANRVKFTVG